MSIVTQYALRHENDRLDDVDGVVREKCEEALYTRLHEACKELSQSSRTRVECTAGSTDYERDELFSDPTIDFRIHGDADDQEFELCAALRRLADLIESGPSGHAPGVAPEVEL